MSTRRRVRRHRGVKQSSDPAAQAQYAVGEAYDNVVRAINGFKAANKKLQVVTSTAAGSDKRIAKGLWGENRRIVSDLDKIGNRAHRVHEALYRMRDV